MPDNIPEGSEMETNEIEGAGDAEAGRSALSTRQMVQLAIVIAMGLVLLLGFVFVVIVMALRASKTDGEDPRGLAREDAGEIAAPRADEGPGEEAGPDSRIHLKAGERLLSLGGDEERLVLYLHTDKGEEIRVVDAKTGAVVRQIEVIRGTR
jgi:hypothetical protein